MNKKIYIIVGATASGKSDFAIEFANENNGVIINCDSLQTFSDLKILTAHPDQDDLKKVPHKLYGFIDGELSLKDFSVGKWLKLAKVEIEDCWDKDKTPIICGGTGFYIKSLIDGLSPILEIDEEYRLEFLQKYNDTEVEKLYEKLKDVDIKITEKINSNDRQRILRALMVYEKTGIAISEFQSRPKEKIFNNVEFITIWKNPDREKIYQNIEGRFDKMLNAGAIEQVKYFYNKYKVEERNGVLRAVGATQIIGFLNGEISLEEARALSISASKKYARRQLIFIRGQLKIDQEIND